MDRAACSDFNLDVITCSERFDRINNPVGLLGYPRPRGTHKDNDSDCAILQVLLITQVLIRGDEYLAPSLKETMRTEHRSAMALGVDNRRLSEGRAEQKRASQSSSRYRGFKTVCGKL